MGFRHLRPSSQQHWWEEFLPWAMTEIPHGFLLPENSAEFQAGDPDGMTSETDGRKLMPWPEGLTNWYRKWPYLKGVTLFHNIFLDIYVTFSFAKPHQSHCSLHQHFHTQQPYSSRQGHPCGKVFCEPNAMNRRGHMMDWIDLTAFNEDPQK